MLKKQVGSLAGLVVNSSIIVQLTFKPAIVDANVILWYSYSMYIRFVVG